MKHNVIIEDGKNENGTITFYNPQRGTILITDWDIVFEPILLNAGKLKPRIYHIKDITDIKKGALTHLYIYLTANRIIRLNTLNKKAIISELQTKKDLINKD